MRAGYYHLGVLLSTVTKSPPGCQASDMSFPREMKRSEESEREVATR